MQTINSKKSTSADHHLMKTVTGFTVLEIIVVLTVIGILGAYVAVTSTQIIDKTNELSEMNRLKAHLKFAQSRAISSSTIWGVHFNSTDYALFQYDAGASFYFFPGEEKDIATPTEADCKQSMPSGKTYSQYVWFDKFGRAYANSTLSPGTTPPVAVNFTGIPDITIEANTGYIHDS